MTPDGWHLRFDEQGKHELFAYQLAVRYFDSIVPLTLPWVGNGRVGSVQRLVGPTAHAVGPQIIDATRTAHGLHDLAQIVGLDLVLGNTDRTGENWCIRDDGRLAAIDNENLLPAQITLNAALRPAYQCDLIDDVFYTPLLIRELTKVLKCITVNNLAPESARRLWNEDLNQWFESFHTRQNILTIVVA